jgi:hypothetical protein
MTEQSWTRTRSLFGMAACVLIACGGGHSLGTGDGVGTDAGAGSGDLTDGGGGSSGAGSSSGTPSSSGGSNGAGGSSGSGSADSAADTGRPGDGDATAAGDTSRESGGPGDSGSSGEGGIAGDGAAPSPLMTFFVSSDTSATGNLGGLAGADARCQRLAAAVGQGTKTWRAYLSADNPVTNARDRIGNGSYYNSLGALVASDNAALHLRNGDPAVFVDEHGNRINGQWAGSPAPLQHDILTGATRDGMLNIGLTCGSWASTTGSSFVGHTDGLGPGMSTAAMYLPWNASHTGQCANTAPGGGAGRIYCFVGN